MKLKIVNTCILLVLALSTVLLMATVNDLSNEKKDNCETIAKLEEQNNHLKKGLSHYEKLHEKEKKQKDFQKFRDNVLQLKYPKYSNIIKVVYKKSVEYQFDPYLIMALVQVESDFNQYAVSTAGAYGLMQVNYSVWKEELDINFDRIFEKEYNIDLGLRILRHYYEKTGGNMFTALFHYNNGYKYKNANYNGKIIATRFYAHRKKA